MRWQVTSLFASKALAGLVPALVALLVLSSCGTSGDGAESAPDLATGVRVDTLSTDLFDPLAGEVTAPARVAQFPPELPFEVTRVDQGDASPPSAEEVDEFTQRLVQFFVTTEYFTWTRRHSHGVDESNPWGEPSYLFWWQDTVAVKEGDLVTFRHDGGADNMMAWHGRVIGPLLGAYLTLSGTAEHARVRELLLGYIRAISATLKGSIWAEENPVVETIMARGIFHRNHTWELDGGRMAAVDYEPVRHEVFERRHDTLHNANNPTWGDIYVRTKRSKDDFPWVYRAQVRVARLLWSTNDPELRDAALELYDRLQAFAADILEHGYLIRAKAQGGEIFIPLMEGTEVVDDFASMVSFEELLPNAECNAKVGVALIATGETLDTECEDGISELYEAIAMDRYYGHLDAVGFPPECGCHRPSLWRG